MNKNKGKKSIIVSLLFITTFCISLFPFRVVAKTVSDNDKCKDRIGITIGVTKYARTSGYSNGNYTNSVADRIITIKGNSSYRYTLRTYIGRIGTVENLEGKGVASEERDFDGETTVTVQPGYEALVVVTLLQKGDESAEEEEVKPGKKHKCYTEEHVPTYNSKGKDEQYCCTGDFIEEDSDSDTVVIKGNAASKFVQNPGCDGNTDPNCNDNLYVKNLRAASNEEFGTACKNALNGIHTKKGQFNIKSENLQDWKENYYKKILSYCNTSIVPFNLDEKDVEAISNRLIVLYNRAKKLESLGTSDFDDVKNKINQLKSVMPNSNYYILDTINNSFEGNENVLRAKLQCDNKNIQYDEGSKAGVYKEGFGEEQYLYAKTQSETATIKSYKESKGKYKKDSIKVCDTICYEHLKVIYSPPKVVKAGLCFQYRVTIKSVTDCGVQIGDFLEKLTNAPKEMCAPNPVCENDEKKTQAGPSEEFDSCINSCDNGNYSQKCINSCYKKVYSNTKKEKATTNISNNNDKLELNKPSFTINFNKKENNVSKIAKYEFTEKQLEDYATNPINKCTNENVIANLDECANYYYQAKTLHSMGEYTCDSSGECTWDPGDITVQYKNSRDIEPIYRQIRRASPFYLRDVETTKNLITGLFNANKAESANRKYYISADGIKTQTSKTSNWTCDMSCKYGGCTNKNSLTSEEYTNVTKDNLDSVNEAIAKCNASAACDTNNNVETEFEIDITTDLNQKSLKENQQSRVVTIIKGNNKLKSTEGVTENKSCPSNQKTPSMFVPAFKNDTSENGILGLCYDLRENNEVHYQTTITFPGSWINLKTGELSYDCESNSVYRRKEQYYCTPYNSNNVNEQWWNWAAIGKYRDEYHYSSDEIDWNISASLGKDGSNKGFGKYRWNIGFSCFYSQYDGPCEGEYCNEYKCYQGDEGNKVECGDGDNDKNEKQSTKLNYDIRVVSLDNLFPKDRLRGFNWGSDAKLVGYDQKVQKQLADGGYDIDPVTYSKTIIGSQGGKGEVNTYKDSERDFYIVLNAEQVKNLKEMSFEDYLGHYSNEPETIPGLRYYMMSNEFKNAIGLTDSNIRWTPGKNNG